MENFLIDIDTNTNEINVKLTDFGLAKELKPGYMRKGGSGTLITMSPEILEKMTYT